MIRLVIMKRVILLIGVFYLVVFSKSNPIVTTFFTADPAALVHNDTVYIFMGHDEASSQVNSSIRLLSIILCFNKVKNNFV